MTGLPLTPRCCRHAAAQVTQLVRNDASFLRGWLDATIGSEEYRGKPARPTGLMGCHGGNACAELELSKREPIYTTMGQVVKAIMNNSSVSITAKWDRLVLALDWADALLACFCRDQIKHYQDLNDKEVAKKLPKAVDRCCHAVAMLLLLC